MYDSALEILDEEKKGRIFNTWGAHRSIHVWSVLAYFDII